MNEVDALFDSPNPQVAASCSKASLSTTVCVCVYFIRWFGRPLSRLGSTLPFLSFDDGGSFECKHTEGYTVSSHAGPSEYEIKA